MNQVANTVMIPVEEYEGLRKDAERYRWLRDKSDEPAICIPEGSNLNWEWVPIWSASVADAAIDAAMKGEVK